jgi:hypothetical protein
MAFYRDPEKIPGPVEQYTDPDGQTHDIYNKASYLEHVTLRNTNSDYRVQLTSSGLLPEIIAPLPIETVSQHIDKTANGKGYTFLMRLKHRAGYSTTPSLKMMYIFRNGFSAVIASLVRMLFTKQKDSASYLTLPKFLISNSLLPITYKHACGRLVRRA